MAHNITGTTWIFNATISQATFLGEDCTFTSHSTTYTSMNSVSTSSGMVLRYGTSSTGNAYYYSLNAWINEDYRTVEFTSAGAVSDTFYNWLSANATEQTPVITYSTTNTELKSIADAIRAKGGTASPLVYPTGFVSSIDALDIALPVAEAKAVNFYDYDGTIRYSYSAAEFAALTALPPNPVHSGLTSQGWNWTLSDAQDVVEDYGILDIGQMYVPTDGKTHLHITIPAVGPKSVTLQFDQTIANGVTINFGEGNDTTVAGTGSKQVAHTYSTSGTYDITLSVTSGTCALGYTSYQGNVLGMITNNYFVVANYLTAAEIGSSTSLKAYAFSNCYSLQTVTTPSSLSSIKNNAFDSCYSLKHITIPTNVTMNQNSVFYNCYSLQSIATSSTMTGTYLFYNCCALSRVCNLTSTIGNYFAYSAKSLKRVSIDEGITSIGNYAFYQCYGLTEVYIPEDVISIGSYAFANCTGMTAIHVGPISPPTIQTTTFTNLPSTCVIYVPEDTLEDYQTTTNWLDYASQMVEE